MKIKIHDLTWEVKFVCGIDCDEDMEVSGATMKMQQLIVIDITVPKEMLRRTIVHELVHAFIWTYGLENSKPFSEEQVCNFFETYYQDIIKLTDKILKVGLKLGG